MACLYRHSHHNADPHRRPGVILKKQAKIQSQSNMQFRQPFIFFFCSWLFSFLFFFIENGFFFTQFYSSQGCPSSAPTRSSPPAHPNPHFFFLSLSLNKQDSNWKRKRRTNNQNRTKQRNKQEGGKSQRKSTRNVYGQTPAHTEIPRKSQNWKILYLIKNCKANK